MRCRRCGACCWRVTTRTARAPPAMRSAAAAAAGRNGWTPYRPAGDLYLEFLTRGPIGDYHRELDLDTASATVSYLTGGRRFTRQYVAHLAEDLILVRVTHEGEPFDCVAWLDRTYDADCELTFDTDAAGMDAAGTGEAGAAAARLTMAGEIRDGVDFRVQGDVWCRGGRRRVVDGRKLLCEGVTEAVFAVDIGVSAFGRSAATECTSRRLQAPAAEECGARRLHAPAAWDDLFRAHVCEHRRHYGSMQLDLALAATDVADLPTDERIRRVRQGQPDPGLALLYFHYGRYLLCASSANAALPANLQGKWNEDLQPPWDSDYHHDVNLQMNYWLAEPAGMQRYVEALLQHIERLVPHARKAAMDLYGCRGVWYPIQTDAWGRSTPESYGWAVWIGAGPPLAGAAPVVALRVRARRRLPARPRLSLLQGGGHVPRGLPDRRRRRRAADRAVAVAGEPVRRRRRPTGEPLRVGDHGRDPRPRRLRLRDPVG